MVTAAGENGAAAVILSDRTLAGLRLFNDGDFDGCHHLLQQVWVDDGSASRLLLQAVIQVSAACIHVRHGHRRQALTMLARARPKLERFRPRFAGVDVDGLVAAVDDLRHRLAAGVPTAEVAARLPRLRFRPPAVPA